MLSVHQFVSHLDPEHYGVIVGSKEQFLAFIRERFAGLSEDCAQLRRDLYAAARAKIQGQRVLVDALPNERAGAEAVVYAVCKLADQLQARGSGVQALNAWHPANQEAASRASAAISAQAKSLKPTSNLRVYRDERWTPNATTQKRWRAGYNGAGGWATSSDLYPRFPFVVTVTANGRETARYTCRADRLKVSFNEVVKGRGRSRKYVAAIAAALNRGEQIEWQVSHPKVQGLVTAMRLQAERIAKRYPKLTAPIILDELPTLELPEDALPQVECHPEVLKVSETLHFEASSRETGYARVMVDDEEVARVRCWRTDDPVSTVNPEHDLIRGGTIKQVAKPRNSRVLQRGEMRVIELETKVLSVRDDKPKPTSNEDCSWFVAPPKRGSERLLGLGTSCGEIWLRGTADLEVMRLQMRRLNSRVIA
jgi:hypothetical protein